MPVRDYLKVLRRRWWIVALLALSAAAGAYAYSKLMRPVYRATATISVTPARADYGNGLALQNLLNLFARELQSHNLAQDVSDQLQLDLPAEVVQGKIKAVATNAEMLIRVDVEDIDAGRAQAIANKLTDLWVNQAKTKPYFTKGDGGDVAVLDQAELPQRPVRPRWKVNTAAGLLLGLVAGVLLAFLAESLDDSFKTPDDVERYLGLTTLGSIPAMGAIQRRRRAIQVLADHRQAARAPGAGVNGSGRGRDARGAGVGANGAAHGQASRATEIGASEYPSPATPYPSPVTTEEKE